MGAILATELGKTDGNGRVTPSPKSGGNGRVKPSPKSGERGSNRHHTSGEVAKPATALSQKYHVHMCIEKKT